MKQSVLRSCLGLIAVLLMTACAHTSMQMAGPPVPYEVDSLKTFAAAAKDVNKANVFAIGSFEDQTGKFMDGDQPRYSRAMSQASRAMVTNFMTKGGFRVVERDPYNITLITREYQMAHTYTFNKEGVAKEQAGLIKRGGPDKGLTGANFVVTGAIESYQVSRFSGGGGIEINAIGAQYQVSEAVIKVHVRIVDLNTSEVVASTEEVATIKGFKVGINGIKLVNGSGQSITVVSAEAGMASQFPADFALSEAIIQGLGRVLTTPGTSFYKVAVDFNPKPQAKTPAAEGPTLAELEKKQAIRVVVPPKP